LIFPPKIAFLDRRQLAVGGGVFLMSAVVHVQLAARNRVKPCAKRRTNHLKPIDVLPGVQEHPKRETLGHPVIRRQKMNIAMDALNIRVVKLNERVQVAEFGPGNQEDFFNHKNVPL
jgi:hypothetical protein